MADSYLRIREKENAKEWRMDDAAAKGHIYSHFNENVEEDSESERDATLHLQQLPRLRATQGNQLRKPNSFASPRRPLGHKKIILLGGKRDNAAKRAFRNGQLPDGIIDLGKSFRDIDPSFANIILAIEEIGVRLDSFILPPTSLKETKLQIWGSERQVHLTKTDLRLWIFRVDSRQKSGEKNFAKIYSSISERYARDETKAKRDAHRQLFQQAPRKDQTFQWNGHFLWPDDEVRATELLGPSCEAFDPLRRDFKVYIVFDEKRSLFSICSESKPENVDKAVQRIRNTYREYIARDEGKITLLFVQPPAPTSYREEVGIVPGPLLGVSQTPSSMPELKGKRLEGRQVVAWKEKSTQMTFKNKNRAFTAIKTTIKRLPYYRGRIRMRVRFGTFTLVKFQWPPGRPSVTLDQFLADMQSAGTKGMVIRDLRLPSAASKIVQRCHSASDIFVPYGTVEESLADVKSQYTVMFYLRHPVKVEQVIQLEVEFGKTGVAEDSIEPMQYLWKRSGIPDTATQGPLLEVYNIRLPSAVSWEFSVSAENTVDPSRITPRMEEFANSVRFKQPPVGVSPEISACRIFTCSKELPIVGIEQKTTLRYRLKNHGSSIFELARYDEYNDADDDVPSSTQWGATLYDEEWDLRLQENAGLGIGQMASWDPAVDHFFTPNYLSESQSADAGFKEFWHNVEKVAMFIDTLKDPSSISHPLCEVLEDSISENRYDKKYLMSQGGNIKIQA